MRKDALRQELDSYLSHRRKQAARQQSPEVPMALETYDDETPRRSWLSRIFGGGEKKESATQEPAEQEELHIKTTIDTEQLRADLKEVAQIALDACKSLPPDKFQEFKNSNNFIRFKDILKKHGVIK